MVKDKDKNYDKNKKYKSLFTITLLLSIFLLFGWINASKTIHNIEVTGIRCANEETDRLQDELNNLKTNYNEENIDFCEQSLSDKYERKINDLQYAYDRCRNQVEYVEDIEDALDDCEYDLDEYKSYGTWYEIRDIVERNDVLSDIYGGEIKVIDARFAGMLYKCIEDK